MALEQSQPVLHTADVISSSAIFVTWLSAFFGVVPVIAAVVVSVAGAIYYALAIYYHPAVKDYFRHRAEGRVLKHKIKLLKAQIQLAKSDSMDAEFWHKMTIDSQNTLREIQEHIDARRADRRFKSNPGEKS
jgi:hypothetical protein